MSCTVELRVYQAHNLRRRRGEHLTYGLVRDRMAEIWDYIRKRGEYETALVHAGVGNFEFRGTHHRFGVEHDVDVDRTRTFGTGSDPAKFALDSRDALEELHRKEICFGFDYEVKEPGLGGVIDRLGF